MAALDHIKAEIAAIRQEVAGQRPPDTAHLEQQIRDLAARLETATHPETDGQGLAELEAQVARLAAQLDDDQPRAAALHQVEQSLEKLQGVLSQNHRESIEAARSEARAAVKELATALPAERVDADVVKALRQDLDRLRAEVSQPQSQATQPEALGYTLSRVADRIGRLQRTATDTDAPGVVQADAAESPRIVDRRADFIAAARRAAQAAAQAARSQPAAEPQTAAEEESKEQKPGAFARISLAIRRRNRSLLLAAAAIVLALGAVQLYGTYAARTDAAPAPAAPIVQKTTTAAPPPATPPLPGDDATLVAPSGKADASVAFAASNAFDSVSAAPEPTPAAAAAQPTAEATPAPANAPESAPVTLASAAPDGESATAAPLPDVAIGSDKLVKAAASGDPAAAFEVASRYAEGGRVSKDLAKAAEWYERAAKGGVAVAQYRLGSLYERGQGVAKDLTSAVNWYQRAADQGNVNAMHNLAVMMSEGADGPPDADKALQWFLAAADYGVRDSQYNLGVIYARGLGTPQDLVASFKWFAIAAAQGDTDAAARRDEVAKVLSTDDLAKARAAAQAWHAKPPLADANGVSSPEGGWDGPGATLADADRAALVKKIQTLLAEQGFDPGPADGVVGEKTREAVKAYQRQAGIAETGQIDGTLAAVLTDRRG
jgi:localization factor PodJL